VRKVRRCRDGISRTHSMTALEVALTPERRAMAISSILGGHLLAVKQVQGLRGSFIAELDGSTSVAIERLPTEQADHPIGRWLYTITGSGHIKAGTFSGEAQAAAPAPRRGDIATDSGALDRFLSLVSRL